MSRCICLRPVAILILVIGISLSGFSTEDQEAFTLGDIKVLPGEMKSGYLSIPGEEQRGRFIPITVIHGAKKGKVLALVAGIHAYEYPPILALYRLKKKIDPGTLSGTLILVHIANVPAFQRRIIYYNPYDWKNLNRIFPGDKEGTFSQRLAYVITEKIVKKCDALIDMHCGDGNEALIPYTYWMLSGDDAFDKITKEMALAFGIKYIIIDKGRTKDKTQSKYLGNTAVLHSKPAITTESGYLGRTDEEAVVRNVKGVFGVMKLFGMVEGTPDFAADPVWIDYYEVVYSDTDGLFYPLTKMGYYVKKDEKVGFITDYLGNVIQQFHAPFTGIMLYIIETPPANKGEPLFEVGRIKQE